jgi:RNA polymerase sigma factor (sigma-70 family)
MQGIEGLVDNLFRREAGRLLAVLVRIVGPANLSLAEDVVQDALCRALEVWKFQGVPDNPSAWIISVAKHRAIDLVRREKTARIFSQRLAAEESLPTDTIDLDALFQPSGIAHEQLRMMFSCCHPDLSEEAQIALVLHILCGFSSREIAAAFLISTPAAEKRLARAKKMLGCLDDLLDLNAADVAARLPIVQRALYLLFNEGYHGANPQLAIRQGLCREAMYLTELLLEHPLGRDDGSTSGLAALMYLHAARMPAREDNSGHFVPLDLQDRSRWDQALILKGHHWLGESAHGWELSEYQIEAAIASVHTCAPTMAETDWKAIVSLYDSLLQIRPTPVVHLNHAIAVGQSEGAATGLHALRSIEDSAALDSYPFYWAALGEFELQLGRRDAAQDHFRTAEKRARNPFECRYFAQRFAAALAD